MLSQSYQRQSLYNTIRYVPPSSKPCLSPKKEPILCHHIQHTTSQNSSKKWKHILKNALIEGRKVRLSWVEKTSPPIVLDVKAHKTGSPCLSEFVWELPTVVIWEDVAPKQCRDPTTKWWDVAIAWETPPEARETIATTVSCKAVVVVAWEATTLVVGAAISAARVAPKG